MCFVISDIGKNSGFPHLMVPTISRSVFFSHKATFYLFLFSGLWVRTVKCFFNKCFSRVSDEEPQSARSFLHSFWFPGLLFFYGTPSQFFGEKQHEMISTYLTSFSEAYHNSLMWQKMAFYVWINDSSFSLVMKGGW